MLRWLIQPGGAGLVITLVMCLIAGCQSGWRIIQEDGDTLARRAYRSLLVGCILAAGLCALLLINLQFWLVTPNVGALFIDVILGSIIFFLHQQRNDL